MTLFAWQRALIAAAEVPETIRLTGLRVALDSAGGAGVGVVINAAAVAGDLGVSERTLWRRVRTLVDGGWLEQVSRPSNHRTDGGQRRARYALCMPGVGPLSSDTSPHDVAHDPGASSDTPRGGLSLDEPSSCDTTPRGVVTRSPSSSAIPPPAVSDDHLSSSDTATGEPGTRPAPSSDTSPHDVAHDPGASSDTPRGEMARIQTAANAAAAAAPRDTTNHDPGDLPVAVSILRAKMTARTRLAHLRWDALKPTQAAEIEQLVELHGDDRLVEIAAETCRRDVPPQTPQAFLGTWRALPPPGRRLGLVPEPPCTEPGHTGTTRHCRECASEALVDGGRSR